MLCEAGPQGTSPCGSHHTTWARLAPSAPSAPWGRQARAPRPPKLRCETPSEAPARLKATAPARRSGGAQRGPRGRAARPSRAPRRRERGPLGGPSQGLANRHHRRPRRGASATHTQTQTRRPQLARAPHNRPPNGASIALRDAQALRRGPRRGPRELPARRSSRAPRQSAARPQRGAPRRKRGPRPRAQRAPNSGAPLRPGRRSASPAAPRPTAPKGREGARALSARSAPASPCTGALAPRSRSPLRRERPGAQRYASRARALPLRAPLVARGPRGRVQRPGQGREPRAQEARAPSRSQPDGCCRRGGAWGRSCGRASAVTGRGRRAPRARLGAPSAPRPRGPWRARNSRAGALPRPWREPTRLSLSPGRGDLERSWMPQSISPKLPEELHGHWKRKGPSGRCTCHTSAARQAQAALTASHGCGETPREGEDLTLADAPSARLRRDAAESPAKGQPGGA